MECIMPINKKTEMLEEQEKTNVGTAVLIETKVKGKESNAQSKRNVVPLTGKAEWVEHYESWIADNVEEAGVYDYSLMKAMKWQSWGSRRNSDEIAYGQWRFASSDFN